MNVLAIPTVLAVVALTIGPGHLLAQQATEPFAFELSVDGLSSIDVGATDGLYHTIRVVGTDEERVTIKGEKEARAETQQAATAALAEMRVTVADSGGRLAVRVDATPSDRVGERVRMEIRVPRRWSVTADCASAIVSVDSMHADATVFLGGGELLTGGHVGSLTAKLGSGLIAGDVSVPAGGRVAMTVAQGRIRSHLSPGSGAHCLISMYDGEIRLELADTVSTRLDVEVGVGDVRIRDLAFADEARQNKGVAGESYAGSLGKAESAVAVWLGHGAVTVAGR